jgi:hypothetical protein
MSSAVALQVDFATTVMHGLLDNGPFDTELSLELGLSVWLHRSATHPKDARDAMLKLRAAILEVSGLDPHSEPFPLIGRAVERDLVLLASYLGSLVARAASATDCLPETLVDLAVTRL